MSMHHVESGRRSSGCGHSLIIATALSAVLPIFHAPPVGADLISPIEDNQTMPASANEKDDNVGVFDGEEISGRALVGKVETSRGGVCTASVVSRGSGPMRNLVITSMHCIENNTVIPPGEIGIVQLAEPIYFKYSPDGDLQSHQARLTKVTSAIVNGLTTQTECVQNVQKGKVGCPQLSIVFLELADDVGAPMAQLSNERYIEPGTNVHIQGFGNGSLTVAKQYEGFAKHCGERVNGLEMICLDDGKGKVGMGDSGAPGFIYQNTTPKSGFSFRKPTLIGTLELADKSPNGDGRLKEPILAKITYPQNMEFITKVLEQARAATLPPGVPEIRFVHTHELNGRVTKIRVLSTTDGPNIPEGTKVTQVVESFTGSNCSPMVIPTDQSQEISVQKTSASTITTVTGQNPLEYTIEYQGRGCDNAVSRAIDTLVQIPGNAFQNRSKGLPNASELPIQSFIVRMPIIVNQNNRVDSVSEARRILEEKGYEHNSGTQQGEVWSNRN